jgi:hypothetical protein
MSLLKTMTNMQSTGIMKIAMLMFGLLPGLGMIATAPESWSHIDTKSGVAMYERWVHLQNDVDVKERKGEMTIRGNARDVLKVISDPAKTKLWMSRVTDAYLIRKVSDQAWYTYTCFSLPWPFNNRDMVSLTTLKDNSDHTSFIIEMTSRETTIPVKPKATRMNNYKATWEIRKMSENYTKITLSAVSFNPPEYPRFVQDKIMRGTFMENMQNLKGLLEK